MASPLTGGAAGQRIHAGQQFGKREGLHQVVVGAGVQPVDAVGDAAARGQHEHRRADAGGADRPQDTDAVQPGQHAVQDHQVVGFPGGEEQPILAGQGLVHDMTGLGEALGKVVGRLAVIFHDQDLHRSVSAFARAFRIGPASTTGVCHIYTDL